MSLDDGQPLVDLEAARGVARECGWSLEELVGSYLRGTGRQLAALRRAVAANDAAEVERLGHGGLGASLSCGVVGLSPLFRRLEILGGEDRLAEVPPILDRVEAGLERLRDLLSAAAD